MQPKHIMVPYRSSKTFENAFNEALKIAKENQSKITVVSALNFPIGKGGDELLLFEEAISESEKLDFEQNLPKLRDESAKSGIKIEAVVLEDHPYPSKGIIEFAQKNNVDLIIVSKKQAKSWKKLFSSDLSEEIADNPPCEVLVVES